MRLLQYSTKPVRKKGEGVVLRYVMFSFEFSLFLFIVALDFINMYPFVFLFFPQIPSFAQPFGGTSVLLRYRTGVIPQYFV